MSSSNSCDDQRQSIYLKIEYCDDGDVKLLLRARAPYFLSQGTSYFNLEYLSKSVDAFFQYPISKNDHPIIVGGYLSDDGSTVIEEHVYISVVPIDVSGHLRMTVKTFTPEPRFGDIGIGSGGKCDYSLNYEGLKNFAELARKLISGEVLEMEFDNFDCT